MSAATTPNHPVVWRGASATRAPVSECARRTPPLTKPQGPLADFNEQAVANIAWAYATLSVHDPALMAALADRIVGAAFLQTFTPQEVTITAWAFASVGATPPALVEALVARVTAAGGLEHFNAHALTTVPWALAKLDITDARAKAGRLKAMVALGERTLQSGSLTEFKEQVVFAFFGGGGCSAADMVRSAHGGVVPMEACGGGHPRKRVAASPLHPHPTL